MLAIARESAGDSAGAADAISKLRANWQHADDRVMTLLPASR
jgi:hypothetical protein